MANVNFDRPHNFKDVDSIQRWVEDQFGVIERALNEGLDSVQLVELHVEPSRPRTGMTVLADGTDWDPGSGQGVYTYYGGSWNKLG